MSSVCDSDLWQPWLLVGVSVAVRFPRASAVWVLFSRSLLDCVGLMEGQVVLDCLGIGVGCAVRGCSISGEVGQGKDPGGSGRFGSGTMVAGRCKSLCSSSLMACFRLSMLSSILASSEMVDLISGGSRSSIMAAFWRWISIFMLRSRFLGWACLFVVNLGVFSGFE